MCVVCVNVLRGRAVGFGTYKVRFGQVGMNEPVLDRQTGGVDSMAHNRGFAVDAPVDGVVEGPAGYGRVKVGRVGVNDDEHLSSGIAPCSGRIYRPKVAFARTAAHHHAV